MAKHLALIEGNHEQLVQFHDDGSITGAAEGFAAALSKLDDTLSFTIYRPHFADFHFSDAVFEHVDGVVFTGSAVNWSADDREAKPARDVMEHALAQKKPIFGSCYGMQLAVAVLGGQNRAHPDATEFAIARNIQVNETGQTHPLYQGKPVQFDAKCMHRDEVARLPSGAVSLSGNDHSPYQSMVYETESAMLWAVQYHPELTFKEIANYIRHNDVKSFSDVARFAENLGIEPELERITSEFERLDLLLESPLDSHDEFALQRRYQLKDTMADENHSRELFNFLKQI